MDTTRPNIVLVSIDSLRADHCGYLGDDRGLTPTLDDIAANGIAFRNAIATGPQTFSSMPAVLTGRPRPPRTYESDAERSHWEQRLRAIDAHLRRYGTLPERLQDLGYSTAGLSPNPWTSSSAGWDRGFDRFVDRSGDPSRSRLHRLAERLPGLDTDRKAVELGLDLATGRSFFARWESYYDALLSSVDDLPEPYFLWVFLLDTHFPFLTGRAHREEQSLLGMYASTYRSEGAMRGNESDLSAGARRGLQRSYRDAVRAVDAFLDRVRSDLAADEPALFVHADHGESFGEHGRYGHHHRQVFEENVHVPYVVGNAGTTADVAAPTSLATIHDAVLATARRGTFDPTATSAREVFTESECGTNRAVRRSRFKYVETDGNRQLFDLERDPGETSDVAPDRDDVARQLRQALSSFDDHLAELDGLGRTVRRVAAQADGF